MGIAIGSNFNYQGEGFLDSRQGMPQTVSDLLNWDILVPLGFEVCVQGEWFTYKGESYWDAELGHWERRQQDVSEEINKLMSAVFPMTLSISPGGTYEVGRVVSPRITWTLKKGSVQFQADRATVNGIEVENPELGRYEPSETIRENRTYSVKVWQDGATYLGSTSYTFKYKKYWGVIADPDSFADILGFSSDWANTWTMGNTVFNCTGGYYPVYAIPRSLWPGEEVFNIWVGGLRNTDYVHTTKLLANSVGLESEYEVITLGTRQTGILNIKFE